MSNLPPLRTYGEIAKETIGKQMESTNWKQFALNLRENIEAPYYMLEINGVGCLPTGDIQANCGQKKNGKSNLNTIYMAVILGSKLFPGICVPSRTLKKIGHQPRVLYVDTEQSKYFTMLVAHRVHYLNNWPLNEPNERFWALNLRGVRPDGSLPAHRRRLMIIQDAIDEFKPDAVFIDGIRDLIGDFNNNEEASELVQELMALAGDHNMIIVCNLHMNPRPGNEDESKMRGHLGTELGNKVSDTFRCTKDKRSTPPIFKVSQIDARGRDVDDFAFMLTDEAGDLGIPTLVNAPTPKGTDESLLKPEIINELRSILPDERALYYSKIREKLVNRFNLSKHQAGKIIDAACKYGVLNVLGDSGNRTYQFNKEFGEDNELPFV